MQKLKRFPRAIPMVLVLFLAFWSMAIGAEKGSQKSPILEPIEWTDVWVTNANKDDLPRVLFVGDSITRGYFKSTEKELDGEANCARYATSAFISHQDFLDGLKILLDRYDFDVVHINNGLHGWDYTEEQYREGFPKLIQLLKDHTKDSTIIWAMTTPIRLRDGGGKLKEESTERVRQRNRIAAEFVKKNGFGTSDLFSLVVDNPNSFRGGGVHFNGKEIDLQAKYVAGVVRTALKIRQAPKKASKAESKPKAPKKVVRARPPEQIDARLPNVLLVGDSICNGYENQVRKLLDGKVLSPPAKPESASDSSSESDLPATVRPIPRSKSGGWMQRHNSMNQRVKQGNVDVIFVGDSITHFWQNRGKAIWEKYYGKRNAVNLGISADRTQHVLWRLQHGNLEGITPKLAVLMIGTNNAGSDSPEDIARGVKAIVDTIEERCPTAKILILGIFPRGVDDSDRRRIVNMKANELIAKFADNRLIFYLDISDAFLGPNRTLSRDIMPDLLHPNEKGYQVWADAIEGKVQELLEEDR